MATIHLITTHIAAFMLCPTFQSLIVISGKKDIFNLPKMVQLGVKEKKKLRSQPSNDIQKLLRKKCVGFKRIVG